LDELKVYDHGTGLNPFLILDGHGSQFELEFLEYTNHPGRKWHMNIGLPCGTLYWQVADSLEQNRSFKNGVLRGKRSISKENGWQWLIF
jgi:hypothetical protein